MKKLIAFAVALLFLSVTGIAVAADITMSGEYFVRGSYQKNAEGSDGFTKSDESGTMYYDHEFDLNAEWNVDDNTKIITQFEIRDEVWGSNNPKEDSLDNMDLAALNTDSNTDTDGDGFMDSDINKNGDPLDADDINAYRNQSELDDNIVVEKVYVWHKFANGHQLSVGLMPSGAWGTSFKDDGSEAYRIKYVVPTDAATLFAIVQKNAESSSDATGQGESDDSDTYYLAMIAKAGNINLKPLFAYTNGGNSYDALACHFALDGSFGSAGFESEFVISDKNYDDSAKNDARTYGAYLNVWNVSGPVKVGVMGAYGSYDDDAEAADAAFVLGPDFDAGGAVILGYDNDLASCWLGGLYADYDVNDKLSVGGYAGFGKFHDESITDAATGAQSLDGAKAWELSADAKYKITDNLVYDVGAGVAQLKWGDNAPDPDKAYRVFNRLTVNF